MVTERPLRLGSRGSALARAQAEWVRSALSAALGGRAVELRIFTTRGDRETGRPLPRIGAKGLFTRELEEALRAHEIDLAVHSLKDLPTDLPEGLALGAVPRREDPRDALVTPAGGLGLPDLPPGARLGSSSLRRRLLVGLLRPDLEVVSVRGNVDTRLRKLAAGAIDGILLAMAGLSRLGLLDARVSPLDPEVFVPAASQGALGIQTRARREDWHAGLAALNDPTAAAQVQAERAALATLGGGCQAPVAVHAQGASGNLELRGWLARPDGREELRLVLGQQPDESPAALGRRLAAGLAARGAGAWLAAFRATADEP